MKSGGALARLRRLSSHIAPTPAAAIEEPSSPAEFACPDWDSLVPMTDEQRFFFDLRGWLLLPAVSCPCPPVQ